MKSIRITTLMIALTFLISASMAVVSAQQTNSVAPATTSVTTQAEEGVEDQSAARDARIASRKAERDEALSAKRQEIIEKKCVKAQSKIQATLSKVNSATSKKLTTYENLAGKLNGFAERFTARGADSAGLLETLSELQTMIDDATLEIQTYRDSVSDLVSLDCEGDPEGFQYTLEEARGAASQIKKLGGEVHSFLKGEVKAKFLEMMKAYSASEMSSTGPETEVEESVDSAEELEQVESSEPTETEPTESEGGPGSEDI